MRMLKKLLSFLLLCLLAINLAFAAININTANQAELEKLPGIGPSKAKAIIEYRAKHGPFKSIEGIKKVSGIGNKIYEGLKGEISVEGAASAKAKSDQQ